MEALNRLTQVDLIPEGYAMVIERFAPSPTGPLHLGHAYSAYIAWHAAREAQGRFLLRVEDLDTGRARPEWEAGIESDLAWLGMDWERPVLRQSTRNSAYADALQQFSPRGLTFACACTRRDVQVAAQAPQEGAPIGPDGIVYPGTCRHRGLDAKPGLAIRLDMRAAVDALGGPQAVSALSFTEIGLGPSHLVNLDPDALIDGTGDIVLRRRDGAHAYHLAVVVDDAHQHVTHVTRGRDLAEATPIHRLLQALLDLPVPIYRHHGLVRDAAGKRLAKRDDARAISRYRRDGMSPADVLALARANADPFD